MFVNSFLIFFCLIFNVRGIQEPGTESMQSESQSTNGTSIQCYQCNSNFPNETECQTDSKTIDAKFLKECPISGDGKEAIGCWKQSHDIPYNMKGLFFSSSFFHNFQ